jgi:hypothetical protein
VPQRLRFLLDTNVLIPLQDSLQVLEGNLANFVRLASIGGHQLTYHPANIADFERDSNSERRLRNLQRITQYPALHDPIEYVRRYFPHYRSDSLVQKFLVPIQPRYHEILFPDYVSLQPGLFAPTGNVGNAIKLAYLCHAQTKSVRPGDVLLFYRTDDEKAVTSLGVVERFEVSSDGAQIASLVSRRTVYSLGEIDELAKKPTKVILFRLVGHLPTVVPYERLMQDGVVTGPIQSIRKVSDVSFSRVLVASGR